MVTKRMSTKNMHILKLESYAFLVGIWGTLSLGDSISSNPERTTPKRQAGSQVI